MPGNKKVKKGKTPSRQIPNPRVDKEELTKLELQSIVNLLFRGKFGFSTE